MSDVANGAAAQCTARTNRGERCIRPLGHSGRHTSVNRGEQRLALAVAAVIFFAGVFTASALIALVDWLLG